MTSCEYASRLIVSAPGRCGAGRPEKRVTARSKLPQKKCTGLHFPTKPHRNLSDTGFIATRARQNALAQAGSYDRCTESASKRMGSGTSTGIGQMRTAKP